LPVTFTVSVSLVLSQAQIKTHKISVKMKDNIFFIFKFLSLNELFDVRLK